MKRVAVFGDTHGNAFLLQKLINKLNFLYGEDIDLWSTGDLIDRGGEEKEVIDLCIANRIKAIAGNHDQWIIDLLSNFIFSHETILVMSAGSTLDSYGVEWKKILREKNNKLHSEKIADIAIDLLSKMPDEHKDYFLSMERYGKIDWLDDKTYWLFHAGFPDFLANRVKRDNDLDQDIVDRVANSKYDREIIQWVRPKFRGESDNLYHFQNGVQIFGHSYTKHPICRDHFIALDTIGGGQSPNWTLSCVVLPDNIIVQVVDEREWV